MILILILFLLLAVQTPAMANVVEASFYTSESCKREGNSGIWTASGERYREDRQTCAHRDYPFGTILKITNPKNGVWYWCRVTDRGPAKRTGRDIDLTPLGFKLLGIPLEQGAAAVKVERKK